MRINVAHCVHGLGPGGAQQVVKHIVLGSERQAFRHYVYSPRGGVSVCELEDAGATVRIIPRRFPKFDPAWALALSFAIRTDGIDVLHTHLFGDTLHGSIASQLAGGVPVVTTLHSSNGNALPAAQRIGYRWLLPRSAKVVACTFSAPATFSHLLRGLGGEVLVIPNGIEPDAAVDAQYHDYLFARRQLGIDGDVKLIGAIGRMVAAKRFADTISAFSQLCSNTPLENLGLVLLGDGPLRSKLEQQVRHAGLEQRVLFAGFRADARKLLPAFDVVVFSSLYEGLSMALLEAMSYRCCIVATAAPGTVDALRHDVEALLVDPCDTRALASRIAEALGNPLLRRRLGDAACRRFMSEFTARRMVKQYEAVYREVHGARARHRGVSS